MMRVVTNLVMFVDVTKPRAFDADDLNKELPEDTLLLFAFGEIKHKAADASKVLVKDVRDLTVQSCIESVLDIVQLLKNILTP